MRVPSLREVSVAAAAFLAEQSFPPLPSVSCRTLVVGSGNAAATGRVLFPFALHATESSFDAFLSRVSRVLVVSASGAKHAPLIAQRAREAGKRVLLLTTRVDAPARAFAHKVIVTPAREEPFSYNTSTYAGMLAMLGEEHDWGLVGRFSSRLNSLTFPFRPRMLTLVLSDDAEWLVPFLRVKGDELFAAKLPLRVFTASELLHAKTIIPDAREVFLVLDARMPRILANRVVVRHALPRASHAVRLLLAYALVGRVQELMPDWFGRHVPAYVSRVRKVFSQLEGGREK